MMSVTTCQRAVTGAQCLADGVGLVWQVVVSAKTNLGEIISALEFMDADALSYVINAGHRHPLEGR